MMIFSKTEIFLWLIAWGGAFALWSWSWWRTPRNSALVGLTADLLPPNAGRAKIILIQKWIVGILGLFGFLGMLAAPFWAVDKVEKYKFEREMNDIWLLLDLSRSMLANDFDPNRLVTAQNEIVKFLKLRSSDRLGIILFSEQVFKMLPMTFIESDEMLNDIADQVMSTQVGPLGNGTNIGDAIVVALASAKKSKAKNKTIILFTDGVSQVDKISPLDAAQMAQKEKIKIYTVGIGSDKDAKIPVNQFPFGLIYQNIPGGSIDEETLIAMSQMTGGKYYRAKTADKLENILSEIARVEKGKLTAERSAINGDFLELLMLAFCLFLLSEGLNKIVFKYE
jgi:Ca-activated chloride channel family protein